jgi:hypothetical protein
LWDELDIESRLDSIRGWALQGSTDEEMFNALGVSKDTYYKWKKEKPEFREAIKKGKYESNGEILNSAFKQASGYYQSVTEPMKVRDVMGAEEIQLITYDKFIPANNTMAIFMLKNRMPAQYKDKQDINHSGNIGVTLVDDVPKEDDE